MIQSRRKLGAKQAAHALGVSLKTLATWRRLKLGPPFFKVSRNLCLYDEEELDRWLQKTRVDPNGS